MTKALRIFTLMMAAALLFTSLGINVTALNIYGVTDNSHKASYGEKSLPLPEYDPNGKTVAYTKDGNLCPTAHPGSSCSNCKVFTYTYHVNGKKYTGSAKQCYGFAFYVQQQLFGVFYQSAKEDNANKFDVIRSFDTKVEDKKQGTYTRELFKNVKLGAHIRVNNNNGFLHSMIYMDSNDKYVWTYEANVGNRNNIKIVKRTWQELYRFMKKGFNYIASPKAELLCRHAAYNDYGRCTLCGEEYPLTVRPYQSVVYRTVKDNVPLRNRPYAPEPATKTLKKGAFVTVVGQATNSKGNSWYKLSDGSWIFSGNVKQFFCPHSSKTANYDSKGYCKLCPKEYGLKMMYPLSVTLVGGNFRVLKDNVPVRKYPYSPFASVYTVNKGDVVKVVGTAKNAKKNLWCLLEDGNWIFFGNVEPMYDSSNPKVEIIK